MKKLTTATLLIGSIIFSACNGNSTNKNERDSTSSTMVTGDSASAMNKMSTTDTSKMASTAMVDQDTKDFANEAATGGMMEVELGNIAMKKASAQSVKDFGKMMVDDHTKINDQLKDLASKKGINLPTSVTSDQQKEIDKLSKKNGADFDKDYVFMMVDDHKKDIAAFKKNGDKLRDLDFKNFISNALPTLQKHLDAIESIKKKM